MGFCDVLTEGCAAVPVPWNGSGNLGIGAEGRLRTASPHNGSLLGSASSSGKPHTRRRFQGKRPASADVYG
jgi:hypothetical protein